MSRRTSWLSASAFDVSGEGQPAFVHAYVEYLTWVSMDPYTALAPPDDQQWLGLNDDEYHRPRLLNRNDLLARATRLRQFAEVG